MAQAGIQVQLHSPEGSVDYPKATSATVTPDRTLLVAAQPPPRGSQRRSVRSPGTSGGPGLLGPAASRMVKTDLQAHLRTSHQNSPDTYDSSRRSSTRSQMNREDGRPRMSFIQNPSFEGEIAPWKTISGTVSLSLHSDPSIARSGTQMLSATPSRAGDSFGQDIDLSYLASPPYPTKLQSISCFCLDPDP